MLPELASRPTSLWWTSVRQSPRMRRWGERLISLFVGQTLVQVVSVLTGFLLLRWMSLGEFAQFGVVFGFQCMFAAFVDLGFSGCIVSLAGARGEQPGVVGAYIAAARWFRRVLFIALLPVAGFAFWFIGRRHGWSIGDQALLFGCIIASLYFDGWRAWFSGPLLIHYRISEMYRVQVFAALARLFGCAALYAIDSLNAVNITGVYSATFAWMAFAYKRLARPLVQEPTTSAPEIRREMLAYLSPLIPGVAFNALQGQLSIFLIAIFGNTQGVAEVSALGRLGQLFAILGAVNGTLLVPYFASLPPRLLTRRYTQAMALGLALAVVLAVAAFWFPEPLLWILGGKYSHLGREIGWMMLGNCLGFLAAVAWAIHSARKWIFWWGSGCYILFVTVTQVAFIAVLEPGTTVNVLYLTIATNLVILVVHAITAVVGFRRELVPSAGDVDVSLSRLS